jgi:hypothetical protein
LVLVCDLPHKHIRRHVRVYRPNERMFIHKQMLTEIRKAV